VPDLAEETARIAGLRDRGRRALHGWVDREQRLLDSLRARPVLADPLRDMARRHEELERLRASTRACVERRIDRESREIGHLQARLTALGPAATLARGYAIVQRDTGAQVRPLLRSVGEVAAGDALRIRVADGVVRAAVQDGADE
jgi:exodeoxyribonuclease VII large subunit